MNINDLLKIAVERKASDLHLKVGSHPIIRVDGELTPLPELKRLMQEDTIAMAFSIMNARQKQRFKEEFEIDIAYSVPGLGRFRCNVFQQRGAVGLVLRVIPARIQSVRELMLPPVLERICEERRGLVLCTGTTGSGKSTTLAAMIDYINSMRSEHILTVEDPIEFLHRDKKSIVNQREIDVDTRAVRERAARRPAPGPRRHPGRRDARLRDHRDRAARGRDRPPGVLDPAHPGRHRDDQPHHLGLPAAPPEADPHPARAGAQGGGLAAPGAARRRHRPRAGGRGPDLDRLHPRVHREQGKDQVHPRADLARHQPVRHADVRPVALPALPERPDHAGRGAQAGDATPTSSGSRSRACSSPPTSRASRWRTRCTCRREDDFMAGGSQFEI